MGDPCIGRGTEVSVCIADGDSGDAAGPVEAAGAAVAHGITRPHIAYLQDRGCHRDDLAHRVLLPAARVAPVEGDPGAGQVEMVGRTQEDPGRIGQRRRAGRQTPTVSLESSELFGVLRAVGDVGRSQMAHHVDDLERGSAPGFVDQHGGLVRSEAGPVHAGVEVDRRGQLLPALRRGSGPAVDLFEAVEHRDQAELDQVLGRGGRRTDQHLDLDVLEGAAQLFGLVELGDEETTAPLFCECSRHLDGPEAVAVGLDHRRGLDSGELLADDPVVGLESPEVDGEVHGNMPRRR